MTAFPDAAAVSGYAANTARLVPGLHDLHRMVGVLLAERVPAAGRVLVLGAGGGMELKALADAQPGWEFDGVDPSAAMLDLARTALGGRMARVRLWEGRIDSAPDVAFDGAVCLLTLHFLPRAERLETLRQLRRRLRPGAPLVVAHHSYPADGQDPGRWLRRYAAYAMASGMPAAQAEGMVQAIGQRLPALEPQDDAGLLDEAGFVGTEPFYRAFTFTGWVACRP